MTTDTRFNRILNNLNKVVDQNRDSQTEGKYTGTPEQVKAIDNYCIERIKELIAQSKVNPDDLGKAK
jgi:hypothetical protein